MVLLEDDLKVNEYDEMLSEDSDEELDDKELSKRQKSFIKDVNSLTGNTNKKRNKKSSRNEPSKEISEFNWSSNKDGSNKLELHDLVGSVKSDKNVTQVKKKLRKMENTAQVLDKPLSKPETQRIERSVAYEENAKDISKWQSTVQMNREAEELVFPMNQFKAPIISTNAIARDFKPSNDLEREISAVLNGSRHLLERKNKELTAAEEEALKAFDLDEAMNRRKELQKSRALQSYYEAKCRRMKKIKSKKYHKIQRKEEQRALGKVDLETLSKENPELFQSELEKAEKLRALERANLRHRNTTKWAKNLIIKGKQKTKEDQDHVREQLRISRELTNNKTVDVDEDISEDDNAEEHNEGESHLKLLNKEQQSDNPWLMGGKSNATNQSEQESTKTTYKKLEAVENTEELSSDESDIDDIDEDKSSGDEWNEKEEVEIEIKELEEKNKKITEKQIKDINKNKTKKQILNLVQSSHTIGGKLKPQQDSLKYLKSDTDAVELNSIDVDDESSDDDDVIYDSEQRMNIREAFANDDVIGDFINEKNEIIESAKPKPVDLTLPGWGDWAGAGLKVSNKKRKRFTKDLGPAPKRKDDNKANVIISEERNTKLAKHQVSDVPFPFSNKEEFERSIRQPIGDLWNTPSVHSKLIEPRIKTTPGQVIDPLKPSKSMKKKFSRMKKKAKSM